MLIVNSEDVEDIPSEWLVDEMIPRCGIGFVYGPSYWGKSLLTNGELALAVANGAGFFGRETSHGSVIVCLGEGESDALKRKTARIRREMSDREAQSRELFGDEWSDEAMKWRDELPDYTGTNLNFAYGQFTVPITRANGYGQGALTPELESFINQAKQVENLRLVILDSLSDFTGGLSISNDTSANRMILGMKAIARSLGCAVLAVAHPEKRGRGMLGAGRLFNAADFVIRIEPNDSTTSSPDESRVANVICEKNKSGSMWAPFAYRIEGIEFNQGYLDEDDNATYERVKSATIRPASVMKVEPSAKPEPMTEDVDLFDIEINGRAVGRPRGARSNKLPAYVRDNPAGVTIEMVVEALGYSYGAAKVALTRAIERKEIKRLAPGLYGAA